MEELLDTGADMKVLAKILVIGGLLVGAAPFMAAQSAGTLNLSGNVSFNASTLTFIQPFSSTDDSGLFANFSGGSVNYLLGTTDYLDTISSPLEIFTVTNSSGNTLGFYDTDNDVTAGLNSTTGLWDITLDESGYYTVNGETEMPGNFDLTLIGDTPYGSDGEAFSGAGSVFDLNNANPTFFNEPLAVVASEPASGLLLGSGLLGLAMLIYMRRRGHGLAH